MKKKLLAAAIMATLTLSASAALAATPTFSGDANIEYRNSENAGGLDYLTNRIRLKMDAQIDDTFYIHGRVKLDSVMKQDAYNVVQNGVHMDRAYIGAKSGVTDIKVGQQSLEMGKGLLMDDDGFRGALVTTSAEGIKLAGFYGKDPADKETTFVDMGTSFNGINFGAGWLKENDVKYYAANAGTKIMDNAMLNVEYAKNDTAKANGFLAEVKVGQAAKKGDFAYAVSYRNIDAGALPGYATNSNFDDSKGFMVKGTYKVTDNATLTAYQDMVEKASDGASKNRTNVEFSVNF